jgi:nucleotide-binding universal stress UspA family protein
MTGPAGPMIVVGVDGSKLSVEALHWAVDYARRCGGRIRAVIAWRYPVSYGFPATFPEIDFAGEATRMMEAAVSAALPDSDLPVQTRVVQGPTVPVLLDEARGADLLVVGSRGHGEFAGMLLGSVSAACVQHATCPVLVFHPIPPDPGDGSEPAEPAAT